MRAKLDIATLAAQQREHLADILFEIGKDLMGKRDYLRASKWLDKAFIAISLQNINVVSADAGELRLSIMTALTKALLECKTAVRHEYGC